MVSIHHDACVPFRTVISTADATGIVLRSGVVWLTAQHLSWLLYSSYLSLFHICCRVSVKVQ